MTVAFPMRLVAAMLCMAVMGSSVMANESDEPEPVRFPSVTELRQPIIQTDRDAIDVAEAYLRIRYGEAELEAQRPLFVLYEYQEETPEETAVVVVVGSKTELTDLDTLGAPMRIQVNIGRQDGRLIEIGFYHGIGVPEEVWVPPIATDETNEDR